MTVLIGDVMDILSCRERVACQRGGWARVLIGQTNVVKA